MRSSSDKFYSFSKREAFRFFMYILNASTYFLGFSEFTNFLYFAFDYLDSLFSGTTSLLGLSFCGDSTNYFFFNSASSCCRLISAWHASCKSLKVCRSRMLIWSIYDETKSTRITKSILMAWRRGNFIYFYISKNFRHFKLTHIFLSITPIFYLHLPIIPNIQSLLRFFYVFSPLSSFLLFS